MMSTDCLSNLDHLRAVTHNLYTSLEYDSIYINSLCEKELAELILQYYQDLGRNGVKRGSLKRKNGADSGENEGIMVYNQNLSELSALELLPNEVFETVMGFAGSLGRRKLRRVSKRLYHKITLLDPLFNDCSFFASRGTPPDYILESDKKFHVYGNGEKEERAQVESANLINRFAYRISSLKITSSELLMDHLKAMKPAEFPHLTSIDLSHCSFDNQSLIQLAPQLVHLKLSYVKTEFDLSAVTQDDDSFTQLKTLNITECELDVKKILTKCSKIMQHLELHPIPRNLENLYHSLPSLKELVIFVVTHNTIESVINLLCLASSSLRTLSIYHVYDNIDFSSLLEQSMLITTLVLMPGVNNINKFLNNCPRVQHLTLQYFKQPIDGVAFKDLSKLVLKRCSSKCMTSVLRQASKCCLRSVHVEYPSDEWVVSQYPMNPFLDTVTLVTDSAGSEGDESELEIEVATKMFPSYASVEVFEEKFGSVEIRRVYNL